MNNLIIKGALYQKGDTVLRAHFTGNFIAVDCTEFLTKEEIKGKYDKNFVKQFTGKDSFYITVDGVKYYETEHGPWNTEGMELLSDLSSIEYHDMECEF